MTKALLGENSFACTFLSQLLPPSTNTTNTSPATQKQRGGPEHPDPSGLGKRGQIDVQSLGRDEVAHGGEQVARRAPRLSRDAGQHAVEIRQIDRAPEIEVPPAPAPRPGL